MPGPFLLPYTMPDSSVRRPLFQRVPSIRPNWGNWTLTDDQHANSYFETRFLCLAACLQWAAENITGGVRVQKLISGNWRVGNALDTIGHESENIFDAVLLASHSVADLRGVPH